MTHITEITPTLKQNTAHRTTQAIKDTKYSANHYRYIINNEKASMQQLWNVTLKEYNV
jgi:hypothetical protein